MYSTSKTIAVLASFAVLGAAPALAGGASVPNTSVATTSLSAVDSVPGGSSAGTSAASSSGYSGMSLLSAPLDPGTADALRQSPGAFRTTLKGQPATATPISLGGGSYLVYVLDGQDGTVYVYDTE